MNDLVLLNIGTKKDIPFDIELQQIEEIQLLKLEQNKKLLIE